ncbi:MAG TPA: YihY/virulence factor BrkB family protein [Flavobacteriales bacterium]
MSRIKDYWQLIKVTTKSWWDKDPFRQSAVIAYYAIFSIPGLLVLITAVAGYFWETDTITSNIRNEVAMTIGWETAQQVEDILNRATASKSTTLGTIIGISVLLLGATGVFVELQKTFNQIWKVEATMKKSGLFAVVRSRLFSFGLILVIAFTMLISLVISTVLTALSEWMRVDASPVMIQIFNLLDAILSIGIIGLLFAMMFKILPDAKIKWRHVWLGSLITSVLFALGKSLLSYYFGASEPTSATVYGAAGSVILILLWVSYSSMILFFGAEFTAVYAQWRNEHIIPSDIAIKK